MVELVVVKELVHLVLDLALVVLVMVHLPLLALFPPLHQLEAPWMNLVVLREWLPVDLDLQAPLMALHPNGHVLHSVS